MQTNYDDQGGPSTLAIEGGIADSGPHNIVSKHIDIAGGIPFGFGTVQGTLENDVILPTATGFLFTGIAIFKAKTDPNGAVAAQWDEDEAAGVLIAGRIWVVVEQAVTVADFDTVFMRHSGEAGNEAPGRLRVDLDTAGADQIAQARFISVASIDSLCKVELNLP